MRLFVSPFSLKAIFPSLLWALWVLTFLACGGQTDVLKAEDTGNLQREARRLEGVLENDSQNVATVKKLGICYHDLARSDSEQYAPKAVETLTRGREMDRKDLEILCYLGSATTMMAKTTWNPMKKMAFVNKGVGYMDKAVKKDPDNITIRMTRGHNAMALPAFLNRKSIAVEDFEYLAKLIADNPGKYVDIKPIVDRNLESLRGKDAN